MTDNEELDRQFMEGMIESFRENAIPDGSPEFYSTMVDRAARAFKISVEEVDHKHINAVYWLGMKRAAELKDRL